MPDGVGDSVGRTMQQWFAHSYPWQIRPAGAGSGTFTSTTGTPTCLGTYYDADPPNKTFVGDPVDLSNGGIPNLDGATIQVNLTPQIITANFNYSGTSTGYYSSGSYQLVLVLYSHYPPAPPAPVMWFPCGNGGLIANPIFYTYSAEGANDMANFDGATFGMTGIANKVGIDMTVAHCSVSVSFKVLIAWTT